MPPNERNTIHLRGQNTDWPGWGCSVDVGFWKFKIQTYAAVISARISIPLFPSPEDLVTQTTEYDEVNTDYSPYTLIV